MKTFLQPLACGLVVLLCGGSLRADVFTIAGVAFDTANAVQTAAIVEGTVNIQDNSSKIFARIEQADPTSPVASSSGINPYLTFDRGGSIGRLLGRSARKSDDRARFISFPEKGVPGAIPNKDRVTIELTWRKFGLPNEDGPDFVIYEVGSYEGFAVSVRKAGSTLFSPYRYQFAYQSDPTHGVNSVQFDLSSFGVGKGEVIDAIRIRNLFNSEAIDGADKVDGTTGEGRVLYPTDVEYVAGHKLQTGFSANEFSTESLDADLIYAVGLHSIIPLGTAGTAPAPTPSAN